VFAYFLNTIIANATRTAALLGSNSSVQHPQSAEQSFLHLRFTRHTEQQLLRMSDLLQ